MLNQNSKYGESLLSKNPFQEKRRNMHMRILTRSLFILWVIAVTALSVISYPDKSNFVLFVTFSSSGFVLHCCAYFLGMLLCSMAFNKKSTSFVLWTGGVVFLYSMVLEGVQLYLPYRTFNPYDVVANGVGVFVFVLIHPAIKKRRLFHRDIVSIR